ncbi:MAG TPA: cbb3-type cytochrome c oxidase subunit 3 [Burkholderiales bacterium]|nr:cbb3-type cytochrome c oxidase subunit 3 [Burkholderiales bacterium]
MDINLLRNIVTVVAFITFLGIVFWAYAPGRKAELERRGRLPYDPYEDGAQPASDGAAATNAGGPK